MIAVTVENVGKGYDAAASCHPQEQILVLAAAGSFIVTTYLIEHFTAKHCRAMGKGNVNGTAHQPPAMARTHFSAAPVNSVAKRSNNSNIRTALNNVPLPSKPIGMRDVVGIHARHYRSTRLCHYRVRAAGESEPFVALVKMYSSVPARPFP